MSCHLEPTPSWGAHGPVQKERPKKSVRCFRPRGSSQFNKPGHEPEENVDEQARGHPRKVPSGPRTAARAGPGSGRHWAPVQTGPSQGCQPRACARTRRPDTVLRAPGAGHLPEHLGWGQRVAARCRPPRLPRPPRGGWLRLTTAGGALGGVPEAPRLHLRALNGLGQRLSSQTSSTAVRSHPAPRLSFPRYTWGAL